jgi:Flp pilus assembly CpaE family ATPase
VVLVDGDLQFGDVANALDLTAARGWLDAVAAGDDAIAFKASLHRHHSGVFVLTAPPSPELADAITPQGFSAVLEHLARIFRYVVVDTTPGVGEFTLAVIEAADHAVFVSNLTVPSLRALRTELDVLARAGIRAPHQHVVVNFVDKVSGLTVKDAARITGVDVGVPVPRSPAVVLASNRGVPLLEHDPKDPAAKAILDLLATITPAADAVAARLHRRRPR